MKEIVVTKIDVSQEIFWINAEINMIARKESKIGRCMGIRTDSVAKS